METVETRKPARETNKPAHSRLIILARVALWGFIACVVIGLIWGIYYGIGQLFYSSNPHFTIEQINIRIEQGIVTEDFIRRHLELTEGETNLYESEPTELRRRLLEMPLIQEADVRRIMPGTLQLTIYGRTPVACLAKRTGRLIDGSGVVIVPPEGSLPAKLPIVAGIADLDSYATGEKLTHSGAMAALEFLRQARGHPKGNYLDVHIVQVHKDQLRVYLQANAASMIQANAVITLPQENLEKSFQRLFYILDEHIGNSQPVTRIDLSYDRVPVNP